MVGEAGGSGGPPHGTIQSPVDTGATTSISATDIQGVRTRWRTAASSRVPLDRLKPPGDGRIRIQIEHYDRHLRVRPFSSALTRPVPRPAGPSSAVRIGDVTENVAGNSCNLETDGAAR